MDKPEARLIFQQHKDDDMTFDVILMGIVVEQCYEGDIDDVKKKWKNQNKDGKVSLKFTINYNEKNKALRKRETVVEKAMADITGYYKIEDDIYYIYASHYGEDGIYLRYATFLELLDPNLETDDYHDFRYLNHFEHYHDLCKDEVEFKDIETFIKALRSMSTEIDANNFAVARDKARVALADIQCELR